MEKEIWKDIEGYEELYQVSNKGRIKSLERTTINAIGQEVHYKTKILKCKKVTKGYVQVALIKNKIRTYKLIHILVAKAFIPNPNNLPQINHKNEKKDENSVENLEWCDQPYNINYGTRNKRVAEKKSKKIDQLTPDGELVKVWNSISECNRNGFHHVTCCCKGRRKQDKGFIWRYHNI